MATIRKLPRKTGPDAYQAVVRRTGYPRLSKTFSTASTAAENRKLAEAWSREHDREANLTKLHGGERGRTKTINDMLDRYMADYDGKDRTKAARLQWWSDHIGHMKLADVAPAVIADHLHMLGKGEATRADGKNRDGSTKMKGLGRRRSPATINRYHVAISSVFKEARKRWMWVTDNPARGVARGQENAGRVRYLSDQERADLLDACKNSDWDGLHLLVILALSTGARLGELWSLTWSSIDMQKGTALLEDTKNGERRMLPLVPTVQDALTDWGRIRTLGVDLVFPSANDPSVPVGESFREHWNVALADAGITDFRFHDLRHSCASYLAMNGATLLEIADVLGHKTLAMVKRYSHLSTDHKTDLVNRVLGDKL